MPNRIAKSPLTPLAIPPEIDELLGPPPVLAGEDPDDFRRLREAMAAAANASGANDLILIDQACRDAFEIRQLREVVTRLRDNTISQYRYANRTERHVASIKSAADAATALGKRSDLVAIAQLRKKLDAFHTDDGKPTFYLGVREAMTTLAAALKVEMPAEESIDKHQDVEAMLEAERLARPLQEQIERLRGRMERTLASIERRHLERAKLDLLLSAVTQDDLSLAPEETPSIMPSDG